MFLPRPHIDIEPENVAIDPTRPSFVAHEGGVDPIQRADHTIRLFGRQSPVSSSLSTSSAHSSASAATNVHTLGGVSPAAKIETVFAVIVAVVFVFLA